MSKPYEHFDPLALGVLIAAPRGQILYTNTRMQGILGSEPASLQGSSCQTILGCGPVDCQRCDWTGSRIVVVKLRGVEHGLLINRSRLEAGLCCLCIEELKSVWVSMNRSNRELHTAQDSIAGHLRGEALMILCCECGKVRLRDGTWVLLSTLNLAQLVGGLSHGYCPECALQIVKKMDSNP